MIFRSIPRTSNLIQNWIPAIFHLANSDVTSFISDNLPTYVRDKLNFWFELNWITI